MLCNARKVTPKSESGARIVSHQGKMQFHIPVPKLLPVIELVSNISGILMIPCVVDL